MFNARSIVCLLCRNHRLAIETGAWSKPKTPKHERICDCCGDLDDEYHLVFDCSYVIDERVQYLHFLRDEQYQNLSRSEQICLLLTEGTPRLVNNFGIFVRKALLVRYEKLKEKES